MRRAVANEVQERRVIRLLAGLADTVSDLPEAEVDCFLARAGTPPSRAARPWRFRNPARYLPAVAAAAVVAFGVAVQVDRSASPSSAGPRATAQIATFPAGNALQLLLMSEQTG